MSIIGSKDDDDVVYPNRVNFRPMNVDDPLFFISVRMCVVALDGKKSFFFFPRRVIREVCKVRQARQAGRQRWQCVRACETDCMTRKTGKTGSTNEEEEATLLPRPFQYKTFFALFSVKQIYVSICFTSFSSMSSFFHRARFYDDRAIKTPRKYNEASLYVENT